MPRTTHRAISRPHRLRFSQPPLELNAASSWNSTLTLVIPPHPQPDPPPLSARGSANSNQSPSNHSTRCFPRMLARAMKQMIPLTHARLPPQSGGGNWASRPQLKILRRNRQHLHSLCAVLCRLRRAESASSLMVRRASSSSTATQGLPHLLSLLRV